MNSKSVYSVNHTDEDILKICVNTISYTAPINNSHKKGFMAESSFLKSYNCFLKKNNNIGMADKTKANSTM